MNHRGLLILGNGIAAVSAVGKIREREKDLPITMITDEPEFCYSRPRLIDYLSGKNSFEQILLKKENWYKENNIHLLRNTSVTKLDTHEKKVLGNFGELPFDQLLIASGGKSILPGIFTPHSRKVTGLRTKADADFILSKLPTTKEAILIGAGLLGIETANALLSRGIPVTVLEYFDRLLPRQLDSEAASVLKDALEKKGLRFLLPTEVKTLREQEDALEMVLKDGSTLHGDLVIVAAGIQPNTSFIQNQEITVKKGIVVNNRMETNVPGIFAAGDCAEHEGRVYGIWPAAKDQGELAALSLLGEEKSYEGSLPSTKLKVAGIEMVSVGDINLTESTSTLVIQEGDSFEKLFLDGDRIKGGILLGNTKNQMKLQKLVSRKAGKDEVEIELEIPHHSK